MNPFAACAECNEPPPGLMTRRCTWCGLEIGSCCQRQHTRQRNFVHPRSLCRSVRAVAEAHAWLRSVREGLPTAPVVITEADWQWARDAVPVMHWLASRAEC